jgi:transposase-like protein
MSRRRRDYTTEFKEQILAECQQIGNVALVARRYGISASTIHTWRAAVKKRGCPKRGSSLLYLRLSENYILKEFLSPYRIILS